jgi:excinuclease ABC subunit C
VTFRKLPRKNGASGMEREKLLERIRAFPDRPGVYLMHDETGDVLYVGKAKSLRKRVASYFRRTGYASPRLRKLVDSVSDISTIRTESEAEALITEAKLIKKYQPFFNVELKMGERYPYIKITRERFPRIVITRHREEDGGTYLGPFTRVTEIRRLLRLVERYFPLRSCSRNLDEGPYEARPCMRHALGRCLAPCAGRCTESEYGERIADILLLLKGNTSHLVERLRSRMERASQALAFEEAARYRDTIRALWIYRGQRNNASEQGDLDWSTWSVLRRVQEVLHLDTIPWRIDGFDISHFSGRETVGVVVVFEQGVPNPSLYRRFSVKSVEGVDDFRSIEEVVGRRYGRVLAGQEPMPQLILIDGGPQQLVFAKQALEAHHVEDVPLVALAKREEELYLPGGMLPLRLDRNDPALLLLQRVRDEAHRFAVTSHRGKRNIRLRRSALEEIPGLGKKRAAALLAVFGSVRRLSAADEEALGSVPGIGPALARKIRNALREMDDGNGVPGDA